MASNNTSKAKKRDILPKIFSILAAFILWFYVVDIRTTIEEKTITGIPVNIVKQSPQIHKEMDLSVEFRPSSALLSQIPLTAEMEIQALQSGRITEIHIR